MPVGTMSQTVFPSMATPFTSAKNEPTGYKPLGSVWEGEDAELQHEFEEFGVLPFPNGPQGFVPGRLVLRAREWCGHRGEYSLAHCTNRHLTDYRLLVQV